MPIRPPQMGGRVPRKAWQQGPTKRTITGRALQAERAWLFASEPLCRECAKHNRIAAAVIRDHVIALAEGGKDVRENTQPLCKPCSDAKTQRESERGAERARQSAT